MNKKRLPFISRACLFPERKKREQKYPETCDKVPVERDNSAQGALPYVRVPFVYLDELHCAAIALHQQINQSDDAADEMYAVRSRKNVEKGAVRIIRKIKTARD